MKNNPNIEFKVFVRVVERRTANKRKKTKNRRNFVPISVKVSKRPKEKKAGKEMKEQKEEKENIEEQEMINRYIMDPNIRRKLVQLGGENVLFILKHFKSPTNDEELAKKTNVKINDIRATLNKLHGEGMLNYTKERDEKTGWYLYSWYFNAKKFEEWVNRNIKEFEIEEGKEYYYCKRCKGAPILFEHAAESSFKCLQCGEILEYYEKEENA